MSTPEDASEQVNRLDQAALDLASDVDSPSEEIHRLLAWLTRNLRGRFVGQIAETDLEEIASDAVQRFMTAARQGRVSASGNPSGYLARIAMNAAIDRLRKDHRMTLVDPSDLVDLGGSYATDDEIAARLDGRADASLIRRALSAARGAGDSTVVRVVTYLLEEIERTGEVPSARAAGAALGLSHTGVAKALERFRAILGRTGASTTGD
jgi:DNA-directed RNA polymerase specialized sigma24 family protein